MGKLILILGLLAIIISFNIWLNAGCKLSGIITWHGKECIN